MAKVFLSPSEQYNNAYAWGNTTEGVQCGKIADACKVALERCGISVRLQHDGTMASKCQNANSWGADLYICIHTNAYNGSVSGTRMFCYNTSGKGMEACKAIYNILAPFTPGTSENIKVNAELYEVRVPAAPTAYIEVDFHDVPSIAKWIVEHTTEIGEKIAEGICNYFGVTYKAKVVEPPVESDKLYRVQVGAYRVKANAEAMLAKLKTAGFDGYIK